VAPGSGLDVLGRRLGERVLDIEVGQGNWVFRLPTGACPATASTWFLCGLIGHFCGLL
jgi:hypothetical protein